jgi:stage IV sporulation protein FB
MLGEPAPTQGDIHFRLFGIHIRIHPLFWLVAVILGANSSRGVTELLLWVAAVLISIMIHELGHALVIMAYGFHPWIVLVAMGGITCHEPSENNRSKANTPLGQISISFAGPAAGFALAGILIAAIYLAGHSENLLFILPFHILPFWLEATRVAELVNNIFFISVFWGLVNLMPIYPLDGGQIVREILLYMNPRDGISQSLILSILTAGLVAVFGLLRLHDWFLAMFFGYLAYESFVTLQSYSRGGRW